MHIAQGMRGFHHGTFGLLKGDGTLESFLHEPRMFEGLLRRGSIDFIVLQELRDKVLGWISNGIPRPSSLSLVIAVAGAVAGAVVAGCFGCRLV